MDVLLTKKPVEIIHPDNWTSPLVFSSPHSGSYYPETFVDQSALDLLSLRQSEDFLVDELFGAAPMLGAPLIKSNYPRAFCDPNRPPYELDPTMFIESLPNHVTISSTRISAGLGTIPKVVSAGKNIYSHPLTYQEVQQRLELCYFPYHAALQSLLQEGIRKFGKILLIDCHSMPTATNNSGATSTLADFILGDRFGNACPTEYSTRAAHILKSFGYSVSYNSPYAGGFITEHYSSTYKGVSALQIEINRKLYMEQSTLSATDKMPILRDQLAKFIEDISAVVSLKKTS
ncbi:MAG: N-formylglutamate amidohydrolase [Sneathiella sp.]|nr:N-formylglutamate amidohydrolase [Sneathiella sp.]